MRTTLNCVGLSAALLAVFITEPLLAGPPRSPYGGVPHPTYASQRQRQQQTSSYRYRSYGYQPSVQCRRSYSCEPSPQVEFKTGDRGVVTGNSAKLMVGSDVLGSIPKGTEFTLTRVQGQWLGASIEIDGRRVSGWVPVSEVAYADAQVQPHGKATGPAKVTNKSPQADREASSGARYRGRYNVRTYRSVQAGPPIRAAFPRT